MELSENNQTAVGSLPTGATRLASAHPVSGNLKPFMRDILGFIQSANRQGPFTHFRLVRKDAYLISDPQLVSEILLNKQGSFVKNRHFRRRLNLLFGDGLLTAEGETWRKLRKQSAPAFQPRSTNSYIPIIQEEVNALRLRWQTLSKVNIHTEMSQITARIITRCIFGMELNLDKANWEGIVERVMKAVTVRLRQPYVLPDWMPTSRNREFQAAIAALDAFIYDNIRSKLGQGSDTQFSLLGDLIQAARLAGEMSEKALRDQVVTLFLAGHETTASALAFAFILLSQSPEVANQLRAESSKVDHEQLKNLQDIKTQLPLLYDTVRESMRLYPPAFLFSREAAVNTVIGGEKIRKGSIVFISPFLMHRDSANFPCPESFQPQRWQRDDIMRTAYIPFSGGARSCIGEHLAMLEACLILSGILRAFEVHCGTEAIKVIPSITLRPSNNVMAEIVSIS